MILAPDGKEKMSKSKGNVITPDEVIVEYGADALRAYEMFISEFEQTTPWNTNGLAGTYRWLRRAWELLLTRSSPPPADETTPALDRDLARITHKTIRKVSGDIEDFRFNTAISALMEFTNAIGEAAGRPVSAEGYHQALDALLLMLAPIAPFLAEEVWHRLARKGSVHQQRWPAFDAALAVDETITLVLQVNGKVRDRLVVPADISEAQAREMALASESIKRWLEGRVPRQVVVVKGRLVNIVV
jgi:leucyl-tRNA synthetase